MRRANQTETAVLGVLSVQPMTGYAVREAIRDVLGHFWSESFGQIYPMLATLERQGYATRQGSTKPGSSVFAITRAGQGRLTELLRQPIQDAPPRNGLMLRLYFGRHLGPAECRSLIHDARLEAEQRIAELTAVRRAIESGAGHGADRPYWLLTVAAGEQAARATLAWADGAIAALEQLDPAPGSGAAAAPGATAGSGERAGGSGGTAAG